MLSWLCAAALNDTATRSVVNNSFLIYVLYQVADEVLLVAWEHVDDRDFNHGVGSWLLLHGCTCHVDEDLCGEGRVVDFHVEFEQLIVSLATDTLANKVNSMTNIVEGINTRNLLHVSLVIHEVGVSLNGCFHRLEVGPFLKLYIYHTAMDACTHRNGHGKCILDAFDGTNSYGVTHRTSRTEISIADSLGSETLHQGTDDGV